MAKRHRQRIDPWKLAVHEAGHGVCAVVLGAPPAYATVEPAPNMAGHIHWGPGYLSPQHLAVTYLGGLAAATLSYRDSQLGREGNRIGLLWGAKTDRRCAEELCTEHELDFDQVTEDATRLVLRWRGAVQVVAATLVQRRTLSGAEVEAVMAPWLRGARRQTELTGLA
jgi:hypothetical protein